MKSLEAFMFNYKNTEIASDNSVRQKKHLKLKFYKTASFVRYFLVTKL